jgi:hypothetical protein
VRRLRAEDFYHVGDKLIKAGTQPNDRTVDAPRAKLGVQLQRHCGYTSWRFHALLGLCTSAYFVSFAEWSGHASVPRELSCSELSAPCFGSGEHQPMFSLASD